MSDVPLPTIGNPPVPDPAMVRAAPTVTDCGCGRPFACGAATGHCWCFDRPAVLPVPAAGDGVRCLCPTCLAAGGSAAPSGGT